MDKKVLRNLSYGVYVVTSLDKDRKVGCIANSIMQITSDPITIAVSINHENYTNKCIKEQKKFAISILEENSNPKIIGTFGFKSSKNEDKFEEFAYHLEKMPILEDSCGYLICNVVNEVETTTHTIFIAEVTSLGGYKNTQPMTYRYYHENLKGTSPKKAPTYIEENNERKSSKKWKCKVCGYVYEGDNLKEDFICPICGVPHNMFEEINS